MVEFLARDDGQNLAYSRIAGTGPTIVYLHGFNLNMREPKAIGLEQWAKREGRSMLLFDYSGCGESGGAFEQGTIDLWRDDALLMIDRLTEGPLVLVGSSMGGWLMLLVALARKDRVVGLVGVAAGPDFTDWTFDQATRDIIINQGRLEIPDPESDRPAVITRAFWESGQANLLLSQPVALECPVRLLHGLADPVIGHEAALRLEAALTSEDVRIILVKGADHSMARPDDLALLSDTVGELLAATAKA